MRRNRLRGRNYRPGENLETIEENQVLATPSPEDVLNDTERIALLAYQKQGAQLRLSADTQVRLFALFLNGHPAAEIQALNKQFSLGQILVARLEGKWDQRRREHVEALYSNVLSRVQQSSVEAIGFLADQMAAIHKHFGEKARKYIQSGDPRDFDDFGIAGIKNYKALVETWQKITGTEKSSVEVNNISTPGRTERDVTPPERRPLSAARASEIIRLANLKKGGK